MTDESPRARRLADRIKVIVAEMLERRIKDPRLGFLTVTDAHVTNDYRDATIFYTVLGDPDEMRSTAAALESAKGVLRTEVGKQTGVRYTPSLTFIADAMPENARHIDELITKAKKADAKLHKRSAGATFAGEADPYKADKVADSEAGALP